jgi:hypothetical protein
MSSQEWKKEKEERKEWRVKWSDMKLMVRGY